MRISHSIYDTFTRCPLQYKLSYIDRIPIEKRPELEFGSLMHSVVENALKKDPIIPAIEESLKIYDEGFEKIAFRDKRQKEQYYTVGTEIIKVFYKTLTPGLRDTIATEKRFYVPLNDKHTLSGAIDRIDKLPFGAYEVIDYKTNFKPKTQQDIDKDKQLGIYHLAIKNLWPEAKDVRLSMYFLKPNLKLTTKRRDDELETLKDEIILTAEKIENEKEYLPNENPLCDWCDFQHLCPLKKQKKNPEKFQDEDIGAVMEEYIVARQKLKDLEPKIHSHFDKEKIEKYHHKKGVVSRSQKNKKLTVKKSS